jgi:hypothetical protein
MWTNQTHELQRCSSIDTNSHSSSLNRSVPSIRKQRLDKIRVIPRNKRTPKLRRVSRHNTDELNDDLSEVTERKNNQSKKKHDTPNFEEIREFRSLRSSQGFNLSMLAGSQVEELHQPRLNEPILR